MALGSASSTVAVDTAALESRKQEELEASVPNSTQVDRLMDQAIQREIRRLEDENAISLRIGLLFGFCAGALVMGWLKLLITGFRSLL